MPPELKDRVALVTGGSRGIGRACCESLATAGANVAVNYRQNEQAADETLELISAAGHKGMKVRADVTSDSDVVRMIDEVEDHLGPVDLLVNNAGIFELASHAETTPDLWRRTIDGNLTGTYLVTWALKDRMIERNFGRIVNVASIAGLRPRAHAIAYAVSKAAVISFTQSLAEALAGHNIRVNAVAPGLINTEILDGVEQEKLDALIDATPIARFGTPEEIAQTVLFLLSERSSFTTGQTLVADGGRVMLP